MHQNNRKRYFITGALFLGFPLFALFVFPYVIGRVLQEIPGGKFDLGAVGFVYWVISIPLALVSFALGILRLVHAIFGSRQEETAPKPVNPIIVSVVGLLVIAAPFILPENFSDFSLVYITLPLGAILLVSGLIATVKRFIAERKPR